MNGKIPRKKPSTNIVLRGIFMNEFPKYDVFQCLSTSRVKIKDIFKQNNLSGLLAVYYPSSVDSWDQNVELCRWNQWKQHAAIIPWGFRWGFKELGMFVPTWWTHQFAMYPRRTAMESVWKLDYKQWWVHLYATRKKNSHSDRSTRKSHGWCFAHVSWALLDIIGTLRAFERYVYVSHFEKITFCCSCIL